MMYCPLCKFAVREKINDCGGFRFMYKCENANSQFYNADMCVGNVNGYDGNLTITGCDKGEKAKCGAD